MPQTLQAHAALPLAAPSIRAHAEAGLDDPLEQSRFTQWQVAHDGQQVAQSWLRLQGLHCSACAGLIADAILKLPGVLAADVASDRAQVRWYPGQVALSEIILAVRAAGYGAVPDTAHAAFRQRRQESRLALWRLFVAAFCAMQVMMMAAPAYFATADDLTADLRRLLNWGGWILTLPVMAFSAGPFFLAAWQGLRRRVISMDMPVALGLAVTFVASSGATFDPTGPFGAEPYFDSLTMFVSFLLLGRWLEARLRHRVAQVLEHALDGLPQTALRIDGEGNFERVSVHRLRPGDQVRVPVGEAIPADGVVLDGQTCADESLLTGESAPVAKTEGCELVAGSINLQAPLTMRVMACAADSRLEGIVALMRGASAQRPALARLADRWASPFLWAVLLLAALAAAVWSIVDPARAVWVAVSVLIVTCPCALALAAPSAVLAATSALARAGVLLRRLDALEALSRIDTMVLDKTGTVTEDGLILSRFSLLGPQGRSVDFLTSVAASLARHSLHPVARAVARASMAADPLHWVTLHEEPGRGLAATDVEGRVWQLGSADFIQLEDASNDPDIELAHAWLACDGVALLRMDFDEILRADACQTVAELHSRGIQVVLMSGDRPVRAEAMGRRLSVDRSIGGATPRGKLEAVQDMQRQGRRLAMVGDGINDAPVLAQADVSLALGSSAAVVRAHADVVLIGNRLADVVLARDLALRTMRVVKQNILWAVFYNAACVPLALVGWLPPWAAGLGMASSSLLVMLNSLRLAR